MWPRNAGGNGCAKVWVLFLYRWVPKNEYLLNWMHTMTPFQRWEMNRWVELHPCSDSVAIRFVVLLYLHGIAPLLLNSCTYATCEPEKTVHSVRRSNGPNRPTTTRTVWLLILVTSMTQVHWVISWIMVMMGRNTLTFESHRNMSSILPALHGLYCFSTYTATVKPWSCYIGSKSWSYQLCISLFISPFCNIVFIS